jgi:hypothetical protein
MTMKVEIKCAHGCYEEDQHDNQRPPHDGCPVHGFRRVREILRTLVEGEDSQCRYDHHGYCQEHGYFGEPGECGTRDAREAVGLA